jgi:glycerate kinase
VVLASDKFKGSLTAAQVADALEEGLLRRWAALVAEGRASGTPDVRRVPVADGGDGTLDAALAAGFARMPITVPGPLGDPVPTAWARRGDVAVVELADCSGLLRLPAPPTPASALTAATTGTGHAVAAALRAGCREVLLGLGGSASTDGGAGLLQGMGAVLEGTTDPTRPVTATQVDLDPVRALLGGRRIVLATDVDNPLLGPHGAAAVYAPQKGAGPADVARLEADLARWADLLEGTAGTAAPLDRSRDRHRDRPGAGAAGGAAFGALAGAGAALASGVEAVLDLVGFADALDGADLVVTGEGSLDEQSLRGKAPVGVQAAATRAGVPTIAVCGRTTLDPATLTAAGFGTVHAVTDLQPDPERAMAEAATYVAVLGERVAEALADVVGRATPGPGPATRRG